MKELYYRPDYDRRRKYIEEIANKSCSHIFTYWNEFIIKGKLPSYEWVANYVFKKAEFDEHGHRIGNYQYERIYAPCHTLAIFQFLSEEFIEHVVKSIKKLNAQKIIEIGAGDGYLSLFLKERGIDIIATDDYKKPYINRQPHVEKLDCKSALEKYNPDLVVINWEEMNGTYSIDVLEYPSVNYLLWIGEGPDGCNGSEELWEFDCEDTDNPYCLSRSDTWNFDDEYLKHTGVMVFYPTKTGKQPW